MFWGYLLTIIAKKVSQIARNRRCQFIVILLDFHHHNDEVSPTVTSASRTLSL